MRTVLPGLSPPLSLSFPFFHEHLSTRFAHGMVQGAMSPWQCAEAAVGAGICGRVWIQNNLLQTVCCLVGLLLPGVSVTPGPVGLLVN